MTQRRQAGFFHKRVGGDFGGVIFDLDGQTNQPYGGADAESAKKAGVIAAKAANWSGPFSWTQEDNDGYAFLLAHDTRLKSPEASDAPT